MIDTVCGDSRVKLPLVKEIINEFTGLSGKDIKIEIALSDGVVTASGGGLCQRVMFTSSPTSAAKLAVYHLLTRLCGEKMPWGALTGVKPLKPMTELIAAGYDRAEAFAYMSLNYAVSPEKLELLWQTAHNQMRWLYPRENTYSLYVHIPFCISKCSYCSFPSQITAEGSELCDAYLAALAKELAYVRGLNAQRSCDCIYIGGGTPSVLNMAQTEKLFAMVHDAAPDAEEFTFEAGRCDTLSFEKLKLLKDLGATRISLNPQTVHDATLARICRPTTHAMFTACYADAVRAGHDNINTDIIIGLPGEGADEYAGSVREMRRLNPAAITLHSLCRKRASDMALTDTAVPSGGISAFLNSARSELNGDGYEPYYLYRQKNAADNAENTGYCRDGKVCIYNIRMMGEHQSIYSAGANSTTKLYFAAEDRFENVYNVKNTDIYINDIERVILKKDENIKKAASR